MSNNMRTAIVTGGGSGIGQAVGVALCAAGWTVVIAGRKVETLERTRQLAQGSGLIETHVADVTDDASVEQLFDAVVERYGRLALLFNNAGINVPPVPLDQLSTAELRSIIATNLLGSFLCARAAFRVMKAQTSRWPDHQQWLRLCLCAPTELGPVHRHQTRYHRINQIAGAGRSGVQHCLRPDRHWERDYRYVGSNGNWGNAG
jgi:NAD(P)-dependent dehydrogenase (short-subunit alcohol dehydrogenase family)